MASTDSKAGAPVTVTEEDRERFKTILFGLRRAAVPAAVPAAEAAAEGSADDVLQPGADDVLQQALQEFVAYKLAGRPSGGRRRVPARKPPANEVVAATVELPPSFVYRTVPVPRRFAHVHDPQHLEEAMSAAEASTAGVPGTSMVLRPSIKQKTRVDEYLGSDDDADGEAEVSGAADGESESEDEDEIYNSTRMRHEQMSLVQVLEAGEDIDAYLQEKEDGEYIPSGLPTYSDDDTDVDEESWIAEHDAQWAEKADADLAATLALRAEVDEDRMKQRMKYVDNMDAEASGILAGRKAYLRTIPLAPWCPVELKVSHKQGKRRAATGVVEAVVMAAAITPAHSNTLDKLVTATATPPPTPAPPGDEGPPRKAKRKTPVKNLESVADLMKVELLAPGEGVISYTSKKRSRNEAERKTVVADLNPDGTFTFDGNNYASVSGLATAMIKRPANGWTELMYENMSLAKFRDLLSLVEEQI